MTPENRRATRALLAILAIVEHELAVIEDYDGTNFAVLMSQRLRSGAQGHAGGPGDWRNWDRDRFASETMDELADMANYILEAADRGYRL